LHFIFEIANQLLKLLSMSMLPQEQPTSLDNQDLFTFIMGVYSAGPGSMPDQ